MSTEPIDESLCQACQQLLETPPKGCIDYKTHYKTVTVGGFFNLYTACSWGSTMVPLSIKRKEYYEFPYQPSPFVTKRMVLDVLQKVKTLSNCLLKE